MTRIINLQIPASVADLICSKTPLQAFDDMVKNKRPKAHYPSGGWISTQGASPGEKPGPELTGLYPRFCGRISG